MVLNGGQTTKLAWWHLARSFWPMIFGQESPVERNSPADPPPLPGQPVEVRQKKMRLVYRVNRRSIDYLIGIARMRSMLCGHHSMVPLLNLRI